MPSITQHLVELLEEGQFGTRAGARLQERMTELNSTQLRHMLEFLELEQERGASAIWQGANETVSDAVIAELDKREAAAAVQMALERDRIARERAEALRRQRRKEATQQVQNMMHRACAAQATQEVTGFATAKRHALKLKALRDAARGELLRNRYWLFAAFFAFLGLMAFAILSQLLELLVTLGVMSFFLGIGAALGILGYLSARTPTEEYTDQDFKRDLNQRTEELMEKKKIRLQRQREQMKEQEKKEKRMKKERLRRKREEEERELVKRQETQRTLELLSAALKDDVSEDDEEHLEEHLEHEQGEPETHSAENQIKTSASLSMMRRLHAHEQIMPTEQPTSPTKDIESGQIS